MGKSVHRAGLCPPSLARHWLCWEAPCLPLRLADSVHTTVVHSGEVSRKPRRSVAFLRDTAAPGPGGHREDGGDGSGAGGDESTGLTAVGGPRPPAAWRQGARRGDASPGMRTPPGGARGQERVGKPREREGRGVPVAPGSQGSACPCPAGVPAGHREQ